MPALVNERRGSEEASSLRGFYCLRVLHDQGRVDVSTIVISQTHECVHRRSTMSNDVIGKSWREDERNSLVEG
jgi:hypothetical protein